MKKLLWIYGTPKAALLGSFFHLLFTDLAHAHGGGVDKNGGHYDKNTGEYHCHRQSCSSKHTQSRQATEEAKKEGRYYSSLYSRDAWPHWIDADHDCQDTRAEILIMRATEKVQFKDSQGCHVIAGTWRDPYSDKRYVNPSLLDIDHVVPLKWAHGHGADRWTHAKRTQFANDMANLEAVGKELNRSKGAQGPDEWMPPNSPYRCTYAVRFDAMVAKYGLTYVPSERRVVNKMLAACTGIPK